MPTDIAKRASVLALLSTGETNPSLLGIPKNTIRDIHSRAIQRDFDPDRRPLEICDAIVADAPRSGRPEKQTPETQD
ncbi:hypothetical protein N7535_008574 [Penicillium sp. DV-2018c]|nr:hypothetical protein N7535_008574 [Penicillium sp. DV-2018c]